MSLGIRKEILKAYLTLLEWNFQTRKFMFGFENANNLLLTMDKRAIVRILKKYGASVGNDCDIETHLIIHNSQNYKNLRIGENCHIGKEVLLDLKGEILIEDFAVIAMRAVILTHFDVGKRPLRDCGLKTKVSNVILGEGCYVGANAIILPGVTINEFSVVGAGAIVTKDVPSYAVVAGVPARIIKYIKKESLSK
jgi:acetyltransferase-like isoleucine patch superfamily enzyme